MRAAALAAFGAPPALVTRPVPQPAAGEERLRVLMAAVHPLVRAMASGRHYASPRALPAPLGVDGIGAREDGQRVYFGPILPPNGTLAEQVVVPTARCFPVPAGLASAAAAALINPGLAAWMPLAWRARLAAGERVLVLGATGAAGGVALRAARLLGASYVVAAGRDAAKLAALRRTAADACVSLEQPDADLLDAYVAAGGDAGFDVVIDYLWGRAAEQLVLAVARARWARELRMVQVGESAGPALNLPAAALRSTGLSITGYGLRANGVAGAAAYPEQLASMLGHAAGGALHVAHQVVPLSALPAAWADAHPDRRLVVDCQA